MSKRKPVIILAIILSVLFICSDSQAAKGKQTFDGLCLEVIESLQSFYPVRATEMGIHAYDNRFTDYSSSSVKNMVKKLKDYEQKLYKYKNANLDEHQQVNYQLVKSNVDIALQDLNKIKWYTLSPSLYVDEAINGVYFLLLSNHAPLSERVVIIISRMKAVPQLFKTAQQNVKNPPPIYIQAAKESLESGINFYKDVAGELMNKFPERADEILKVSTHAREAMNDYLIYLSAIKPGTENSFAIGKNNFDYKLSNEYFLNYDSDSLLKIGLALFAEADEAYREQEAFIKNNLQNGTDSIFVPAQITKQDILDYYNWETNQIKIFLEENDIITIPEDIAPVKVIETPPFLRTMISGIAYQPAGPFDSVQTGYFYVRPIPDDLDRKQLEARYRYIYRRGFKGSAAHEAYPGHHLQMQLAGMNSDPIRKWQTNMMLIEGWALYSEELMYENNLYGDDPNQWLSTLGGIRFRAARIIADVKLHTGQFSYDECVNWMIEALDITTNNGKEYIRKEVRRYTTAPTIQMCYLIGKLEIMNMRDAYFEKYGETASQREFHDQLLGEGSIPPVLMWNILSLNQ